MEADETLLVTIAINADGTAVRLVPPAAAAWQRLQAAAGAAGIELLPQSGFRSVNRQVQILRGKLAEGRRLADILASVAAPGHSEHHTGRALDLGSPGEPELEEEFARTPAYSWLTAHAGRHGFCLSYPPGNPHGFVFEPWHWCWHP
jgi:D-alanyl-D-alanine carboxypeptidase